jgi:hypothetical protein
VNPHRVEVLARLDEDDYQQYKGCPGTLVVDRPYGYAGQHLYNNQLAQLATGDWLMIWNDDALMQTPRWDEIIHLAGLAHSMALLSLDNNQPREYACFPVVPRRWFELCGHLSLDCRVDTWLNAVAKQAGCFVEEHGVYVFHDRADLTGNNDDEVYKARYAHPDFYSSFDEPAMVQARLIDSTLIRSAM